MVVEGFTKNLEDLIENTQTQEDVENDSTDDESVVVEDFTINLEDLIENTQTQEEVPGFS